MLQKKLGLVLAAVVFLFVAGWGGLEATSGPGFCGSCHVMENAKESHAISQHRELSCSQCHVPHSLAQKIAYKAKSGSRDIYHTIKKNYPDVISIKEDSKKVLKENCISCHLATNEKVHTPVEGKECFDCHRNIAHPKSKEVTKYIY